MNDNSNPAVGALPGWRGTDPDGGTWVRLAWISTLPTGRVQAPCEWAQITADGTYYPRTQEEAEAAGLVRLIPAVGYHYDERGEDVVPDVEGGAPLDPGNPEHLRQVRDFLGQVGMRNGYPMQAMETVRNDLGHEADRLDRERAEAEAEQDAAEEAFVQGIYERWCASDGTDHDLIREAIRAERARQEAGQ